jgi:hypothetical protein
MENKEGLPLVKFMMLLSSMSPLFLLAGIRGMDEFIPYIQLWFIISGLVLIPYSVLRLRIFLVKKSNDTFLLSVKDAKNNKEYLFTFLFTVLLPLYSISITSTREFLAVAFAICFVIFVLWNLNLHFINILFALQGYRVYTIENSHSVVLLTTRHSIPKDINQIKAHRLSNSVYIELKKYNYA